ncbi:MAG: outer membrane lipoprotein carrier protein LolA [Neisseria sp.]|nr:outer membrane lipoprotein carrier protein LolA [Neisseria sp.]
MKKLLMMAMLLAAPFAWAFSPAELAQTLNKSGNVEGRFVQQRYLKSLPKPMTAHGKFVLQPGKGLLWLMEKPFDNRLRVRADGIMQWNGKNWSAAKSGAQAVQNRQIALFLDLLGGNTQGLAQHFELKLSGTPQRWALRLQPKTALMKQVFEHIDISGGQTVRRVELHEKQGDRTVMTFDNVQTGRALSGFARESLM